MSACDTCRDPGACCRQFQLNRNFRPESSRERVAELLLSGEDDFDPELKWEPGVPFIPVLPSGWWAWPDEETPQAVRWTFSCPKLGAAGRCTIYDERPAVCRHYEPKHDAMCAEFEGPFTLSRWGVDDKPPATLEPATVEACEDTGPSSSSSPCNSPSADSSTTRSVA